MFLPKPKEFPRFCQNDSFLYIYYIYEVVLASDSRTPLKCGRRFKRKPGMLSPALNPQWILAMIDVA